MTAGPEERDLEVLGHRMRVLVAHADQPRAVVFALHGGGAGKEYFDAALDPALSLLRLGPALGYTVIAPDRPGYLPDDPAARTLPAATRTDLLFATLDAALGGRGAGGGVLLLAHSMGCVSGLRMAADERGRRLLGIEISGTGLTRNRPALELTGGGVGAADRPQLGRLIWGSDALYPPGTRRGQPRRAAPESELGDTTGWAEELPRLAARVRIPVRITLAEHEGWWRPPPEGLAEVAPLFTAAPHVQTAVQHGAAHNISLSRVARAYHLGVLAFAEECLVRRSAGTAADGRAEARTGA